MKEGPESRVAHRGARGMEGLGSLVSLGLEANSFNYTGEDDDLNKPSCT